jgi:hypothetical protein
MTSPMPCSSVRVVPDAATAADSAVVAPAICRPGAADLAQQLHGDLAQRAGQHRPGADAAQRSGRRVRGQPTGQPGRDELGEQGMQPVDGLRPRADQIVTVLSQGAQGRDGLIDNCGVQPGGGVRGDADRQGVGLVGLAAVPGGEHPDAAGQLGGHVHHGDAVVCQPGRQRSTQTGGAFNCPKGR